MDLAPSGEGLEARPQIARFDRHPGPVLQTVRGERRHLARRIEHEESGQTEALEGLTLAGLLRPLQHGHVAAELRDEQQRLTIHVIDATSEPLREHQQTVSVALLFGEKYLTFAEQGTGAKLWPCGRHSSDRDPRVALVGGLLATLVLTAIVAPLHDHVTRGVPALLFVVPVVATAVVGGRLPAFIVAAFATFSFTFALPPIGSPRIELSEDLLALIVFGAVAFVVSALVTTRVSALETVDDQRRALLRSVSHDLRTPLAAIHAVATDLRAGTDYDAATRDEVLDVLIDETDRLDRLVANLLSMSRIEAGTMKPRFAEVDVAELVAASAHRLERLFKHWELDIDVADDLPLVRADPAELEQVCNNLLENAVRHTPEGTNIRVSARSIDDMVEVTVADDGPGLPPDVAERLRTAKVDAGQGLGLAICQGIVRLHGGTLRLTDHEPGTSIAVTVPCAC